VVSDDVGGGLVPEGALARRFRDLAGELNQRVAAACDRVYWVTAGIPVPIKGAESQATGGTP
jgi:adenosylcobinamide kinase/adenosylcobinamide-phosphate guanylyltransferase